MEKLETTATNVLLGQNNLEETYSKSEFNYSHFKKWGIENVKVYENLKKDVTKIIQAQDKLESNIQASKKQIDSLNKKYRSNDEKNRSVSLDYASDELAALEGINSGKSRVFNYSDLNDLEKKLTLYIKKLNGHIKDLERGEKSQS